MENISKKIRKNTQKSKQKDVPSDLEKMKWRDKKTKKTQKDTKKIIRRRDLHGIKYYMEKVYKVEKDLY